MAFTALEVKIKAEVKDLKKGLAQARKEVAKFKSDLDKVSGPLDKMAYWKKLLGPQSASASPFKAVLRTCLKSGALTLSPIQPVPIKYGSVDQTFLLYGRRKWSAIVGPIELTK